MRRSGCLLAVLLLLAAGCSRSGLRDAGDLTASQLEAAGQSRCSVVKDPDKPLIVEWSGMDAAELEARLLRGVVAVRYEDCEMEVLRGCTAPGQYSYAQTTTGSQSIHIGSLDELLINIPLGLAQLGGRVERGEALELDMVVVGRYEASRPAYTAAELSGGPECARATHVVTGVSLGAFRLSSVEDSARNGGGAGFSGSSEDTIEVLKESPPNMLEACAQVAAPDDPRRNVCTAPIRLEVAPISAHAEALAGAQQFLRPPDLDKREVQSMDLSGSLAAHQAYDVAVKVQADRRATPERHTEAWCALAAIEQDNPYLAQARELCDRWRDHASALRQSEARMIHDYDNLRVLLELRGVPVAAQERAAASFLVTHQGLSADAYPRIRAVQRALRRLGRGDRTSLPSFSTAAAGEPPPVDSQIGRSLVDRRSYRKAISVGFQPRWIPQGYGLGGTVLGRVNYVHEVGFEVAYAQYAGYGPRWRYILAMARYERVYRPHKVFRPYIGASFGALIPIGPMTCAQVPQPCAAPAGVMTVNGGARVSLTPWLSLVAQGFAGAMTARPFFVGGVSGGIEFTIPTGRDWPQ